MALHKNRLSLLHPQAHEKQDDKPLVFSMTYSTELKDICWFIKKHIPLLKLDPELECSFKSGFRCVDSKAPTLGQSLSPSLFTSVPFRNPTWLHHKGSFCADIPGVHVVQ